MVDEQPTLDDLAHEDKQRGWLRRALEPADSLAEVTCGLVMMLTILCTAGWYVEGSENPRRTLALAAIGCCLAWGIIDGFLYVASSVYQRGNRGRLIRTVQQSPRPQAVRYIGQQVDEATGHLLSADSTRAVAGELVDAAMQATPPERITTQRADFPPVGAAVVLNVSATILPTIALFIIDDWRVALAISKWLVVAMMFATGFLWGRATRFGQLRSGLAMLGFGVTMVMVAVFLGG